MQLDLVELVEYLFSSFCEVGRERLLKLAGYRSLLINRCLVQGGMDKSRNLPDTSSASGGQRWECVDNT